MLSLDNGSHVFHPLAEHHMHGMVLSGETVEGGRIRVRNAEQHFARRGEAELGSLLRVGRTGSRPDGEHADGERQSSHCVES